MRNEKTNRALAVAIQKSKIENFFASVPQQPQGEFRKLVFVGASPTRGSSLRLPAPAGQANLMVIMM